jgi:hypothetical protein
MTRTRALLLALALESSAGDDRRCWWFRKRKTAFVAALLVRPEDYRLFGLVEGADGIDVLWERTANPKLAFA